MKNIIVQLIVHFKATSVSTALETHGSWHPHDAPKIPPLTRSLEWTHDFLSLPAFLGPSF